MPLRLPWSFQKAIRRKTAFQYPVGPAPRTAVLADWFDPLPLRGSSTVRMFPKGWTHEAADFAPAAIAGTREQLLTLASHPPRLTHALIVLSRSGEPLTTAAERDRLWRAFEVPMFEQIIGEDGRLLAAECDAHDGLHVVLSGRAWDEYWVETAACACGKKSPRLHAPEPVERQRAAAVYAR